MRARSCIDLRVVWLVPVLLSFPLHSRAQSQDSRNLVSVRELSIPNKARDEFQHGVELLAKKDPAGSLHHFQRAVAELTSYYEAYYGMGVAELRLNRVGDADLAFRKSIDLSGGQYANPLIGLGAVLDFQGKFGEAEEVIRKGLNLEPGSFSGHYHLARTLFSLDRLDEADKNAREALRQKSDSKETWALLADIHSREKDYSALLTDLAEYLKLDPNGPVSDRIRSLRDNVQRGLDQAQNTTALAQP